MLGRQSVEHLIDVRTVVVTGNRYYISLYRERDEWNLGLDIVGCCRDSILLMTAAEFVRGSSKASDRSREVMRAFE